jgi:hypothetical protein
MRKRLTRTGEADYQVARDNRAWADHVHRTYMTAAAIATWGPKTVLDPACGDGSIVEAAHRLRPIGLAYLSDISEPGIAYLESLGLTVPHVATVADITAALQSTPRVDMVILTETLEHLPDPDAILKLARARGRQLIASSPLIRDPRVDDNPEHLWQFDADGYGEMLVGAGWKPTSYSEFIFGAGYYTFQLWSAE